MHGSGCRSVSPRWMRSTISSGRPVWKTKMWCGNWIAPWLSSSDSSISVLGREQGPPFLESVRRNFHVSRSSDIYIIQEPYWFLFDKGPVRAMHGSPYRYDTHAPIIFAGPAIRAQTVHRPVHPVDVAPTIAAFLGTTPPGSAQGTC